jgi:transcription initiation factor TFIID subunit 5
MFQVCSLGMSAHQASSHAVFVYKQHELFMVAFPLFVHCFLELMSREFTKEALSFFQKHREDHELLHSNELRQLAVITAPAHVKENELAKRCLTNKFDLRMSNFSYELLMEKLNDTHLFMLCCLLNQRVTIKLMPTRPAVQADTAEDEGTDQRDTARSTAARLAQSAASASNDYTTLSSEPLKALQGKNGTKVYWGVPRNPSVAALEKREREDADMKKQAETAKANAKEGVGEDPTASGGAAKRAKLTAKEDGAEEDEGKKEGIGRGIPAADPDTLPSDSPADTTKRFSKNLEKLLERRSDLADLSVLEDERKCVPLGIMQHRSNGGVGAAMLPSCVMHTFVNASAQASDGLHCAEVSSDATRLVAGFGDGSLRVWRCDGKPLDDEHVYRVYGGSSARGSGDLDGDIGLGVGRGPSNGSSSSGGVSNGSASGADKDGKGAIIASLHDSNEPDRSHAVLRGHSGPVYKASMSPDQRFVLSASADTTIRLWHLPTQSNVVSHLHFEFLHHSWLVYVLCSSSHSCALSLSSSPIAIQCRSASEGTTTRYGMSRSRQWASTSPPHRWIAPHASGRPIMLPHCAFSLGTHPTWIASLSIRTATT